MKMKMKKILCVTLAAALCAAMLCSCGDKVEQDGKTADSTASAAEANANANTDETAARLTAAEYADNLFNGITYVDQLSEISPEMVQKVYGVAPEKYTSGKVYVGGVSTAEEIACFDAVDETAAGEIKSALEARIAAQIKSVEGYNPDELPKLNDPVLVTYGNSVYMCLSNDNDKAKEIIG